MNRHALVIGVPLQKGTQSAQPPAEAVDVERMTALLRRRAFEVAVLLGPPATRDGILTAYQSLIARTCPGDAAVVYFAGHGGTLKIEPGDDGRALPGQFQFIVPADYPGVTDEDFRGVSAWELSRLLGELSAKTANATVILDCCHAAQMSRSQAVAGAIPRAIPKLTRIGIGAHYDQVLARFGPPGGDPRGNPNAVRIVACGEWQTAHSVLGADGRLTGAFTDALITTLDEVGDARVPWRAVIDAVRGRVLRQLPTQRPMVEGPARRQPFTLDEVGTKTISVSFHEGAAHEGAAHEGTVQIDAGSISGISVGDELGVTAMGAEGFHDATAIARVQINSVAALRATARLIQQISEHITLPDTAVGWPIQLALARYPVQIDAPAAWRDELVAAVTRSPRLRVADAGERPLGELRVRDRGPLTVTAGGHQLRLTAGAWSAGSAIRQLTTLAAAQTLRELEGEHGLSRADLQIEWGAVRSGALIPRPSHGAALGLGDRIYLRIANHADRRRFIHVFNIGLRGQISLLTVDHPSGVLLGSGKEEIIGCADPPGASADGFDLLWPDGAPRDEPGVDTLMIIATIDPVDLRALETEDPHGRRGGVRAVGSPMQRLMAQLHNGGTRSAKTEDADPFCVIRRSFVLHPLAAPLAGPGFAIDEDPLAVHAALQPEAWLGGSTDRARPIEIRLGDLTSERAARIDVLVCTRSAEPMGVYRARTIRLRAGQVRHDELLWRGPVRDLVDIYVWSAPDQPGREIQGLAELLAPAVGRSHLEEAHHALIIDDPAAPWSLAGGASLAFAREAAERLQQAAPGAAGLLHTSFASHENYGIGRQPATGRYTRDGVALWLRIVDLEVDAAAANRG